MGMAHFCNAGQNFPFSSLPKDMQYEVMLRYIDDAIASLPEATKPYEAAKESLKAAADRIRDLARVNKDLNSVINQPIFCLKLIKRLAQKFNAFDLEAAIQLKTRCAQERIQLQEDFLDNVVTNERAPIAAFNDYINKGVDLDWTGLNVNPLMAAASGGILNIVKLLLSKGANAKYIDRYGNNALYQAASIKNDKIPAVTIIDLLKELLAAGADPRAGYLTSRGLNEETIPKKEVRDFLEEAQKSAGK